MDGCTNRGDQGLGAAFSVATFAHVEYTVRPGEEQKQLTVHFAGNRNNAVGAIGFLDLGKTGADADAARNSGEDSGRKSEPIEVAGLKH